MNDALYINVKKTKKTTESPESVPSPASSTMSDIFSPMIASPTFSFNNHAHEIVDLDKLVEQRLNEQIGTYRDLFPFQLRKKFEIYRLHAIEKDNLLLHTLNMTNHKVQSMQYTIKKLNTKLRYYHSTIIGLLENRASTELLDDTTRGHFQELKEVVNHIHSLYLDEREKLFCPTDAIEALKEKSYQPLLKEVFLKKRKLLTIKHKSVQCHEISDESEDSENLDDVELEADLLHSDGTLKTRAAAPLLGTNKTKVFRKKRNQPKKTTFLKTNDSKLEELYEDIEMRLKNTSHLVFTELFHEGPGEISVQTQTDPGDIEAEKEMDNFMLNELILEHNHQSMEENRSAVYKLKTLSKEVQAELLQVVQKRKAIEAQIKMQKEEVELVKSHYKKTIKHVSEAERKLKKKKLKLAADSYNRTMGSLQNQYDRLDQEMKTLEAKKKTYALRLKFYKTEMKAYDGKYDVNVEKSKRRGPEGRVAIVFTDIESSTNLWEQSAEIMQQSIMKHNKIIRYLISKTNGYEVKTEGDAFMISFDNGYDALEFGTRLQVELLNAAWPKGLSKLVGAETITGKTDKNLFRGLRVRIGIHVGRPVVQIDPVTGRHDYFGPMVNRAARIESFSRGGFISISEGVHNDVKERLNHLTYKSIITPLGSHKLRGTDDEETLYQVVPNILGDRMDLHKKLARPVERSMTDIQQAKARLTMENAQLNHEREAMLNKQTDLLKTIKSLENSIEVMKHEKRRTEGLHRLELQDLHDALDVKTQKMGDIINQLKEEQKLHEETLVELKNVTYQNTNLQNALDSIPIQSQDKGLQTQLSFNDIFTQDDLDKKAKEESNSLSFITQVKSLDDLKMLTKPRETISKPITPRSPKVTVETHSIGLQKVPDTFSMGCQTPAHFAFRPLTHLGHSRPPREKTMDEKVMEVLRHQKPSTSSGPLTIDLPSPLSSIRDDESHTHFAEELTRIHPQQFFSPHASSPFAKPTKRTPKNIKPRPKRAQTTSRTVRQGVFPTGRVAMFERRAGTLFTPKSKMRRKDPTFTLPGL